MLTMILAAAIAAASPVRSPSAAALTATTPSPKLLIPPAGAVPPPPAGSAGGAKQSGGGEGAAVAGAWRLTEVGGRVDCTLTLRDDGGHPARQIQAPIACQRAFPPLKALTAWSVSGRGAPVFTGDKAKPLTFAGPTGGPYSATAPDGKTWRLTAAPEKAATPQSH